MRLEALNFVMRAGITALAAACVLAALLALQGEPALVAWGLGGWWVMSVVGVAGGAWLVRRHGAPGSGFLLAMGTCMLARLALAAAGAFAAAAVGMPEVHAYLIGLGAGYVPLQVVEMNWLWRRDRGPRTC
jgi:hypothetical protein